MIKLGYIWNLCLDDVRFFFFNCSGLMVEQFTGSKSVCSCSQASLCLSGWFVVMFGLTKQQCVQSYLHRIRNESLLGPDGKQLLTPNDYTLQETETSDFTTCKMHICSSSAVV